MRIVLGADKAGKPLLDVIAAHLAQHGRHKVTVVSAEGYYADIAAVAARAILAGGFERGVLLCGTGIGMCISANKVPGVRAALTHDAYSAERAAKSNNAQIITMGARVIGPELAKHIENITLTPSKIFEILGSSLLNSLPADSADRGQKLPLVAMGSESLVQENAIT